MKYVLKYEPMGWTEPALVAPKFRYEFQKSYKRHADAANKLLNVLNDISGEFVCICKVEVNDMLRIRVTDASRTDGQYLGEVFVKISISEE